MFSLFAEFATQKIID